MKGKSFTGVSPAARPYFYSIADLVMRGSQWPHDDNVVQVKQNKDYLLGTADFQSKGLGKHNKPLMITFNPRKS